MTTEIKTDHILLDLPLPIVTPRLIIRPAGPGDGAEIHAAIGETWDEIHTWMPWGKERDSIETTEASARRAYAAYILREDFRMVAVDRTTGRMAVFTGLHRFDWKLRRIEIGYWTRKEFHGHGLATEAANALIRYAFDVLNARTVSICHADGNEPSRRVIEKLNFVYEGRLRNETILPDGSVRDKLWYSHTGVATLPPLDVTWGGP